MSSLLQNIQQGVAHHVNRYFKNRNTYKAAGFSWMKAKYIKHLPKNKETEIAFLGKPFFVKNPHEFIEGVREIFIEKLYEQQLPVNAVVLDCGAHIGLSVLYIKRICPGAHITAFEPDSHNFRLLSKNVAAQGLENVVLENKAIWKEETTLQFDGGNDMGSHLVEGVSGGAAQAQSGQTIAVKTVRLRDVLQTKVDFLKIDIEGAEYEVMKDIQDKLHLVSNLFLEYHGSFEDGYKLSEMLAILVQNDFGYYITEAFKVYETPFSRKRAKPVYDVQLNIFCFKLPG